MALPVPIQTNGAYLAGRKDVQVYAEAMVKKIATNSKEQARMLVVSKFFTALYDKGIMKRVIVHEDLEEIQYKMVPERSGCRTKEPPSVDVLFKVDAKLNEPDLLVNIESYKTENKPKKAADIINVIVQVVKARPPHRTLQPQLHQHPLAPNRTGTKPIPMQRILATFNAEAVRVKQQQQQQQQKQKQKEQPEVEVAAASLDTPKKEEKAAAPPPPPPPAAASSPTPEASPYKVPEKVQKPDPPATPPAVHKYNHYLPNPAAASPHSGFNGYAVGSPSVAAPPRSSYEGGSRVSRASSLAVEASRIRSKAETHRLSHSPQQEWQHEEYQSPHTPPSHMSHPGFPQWRSRMSPLGPC